METASELRSAFVEQELDDVRAAARKTDRGGFGGRGATWRGDRCALPPPPPVGLDAEREREIAAARHERDVVLGILGDELGLVVGQLSDLEELPGVAASAVVVADVMTHRANRAEDMIEQARAERDAARALLARVRDDVDAAVAFLDEGLDVDAHGVLLRLREALRCSR